jgi:hypothetical protein
MSNFNGYEGTPISLSTASDWTKNYRDEFPGELLGHFVGKERVLELLAQTDAIGIRIYYAINDSGKRNLVLVAAKANKDDITTLVIDNLTNCPDLCGKPNQLNS